MGLQLDGYGSDSGSDASGSQTPSTAACHKGQRDPGSVSISLSHQAKRKVPVKIGMDHPILRKPGAEAVPNSEMEDVVSVPSKRARPARAPAQGRSGLLDLLPPPKKRIRTKPDDRIAQKEAGPRVESLLRGQDDPIRRKPHGDALQAESGTPPLFRSLGPQESIPPESQSDLFGLGFMSQTAINTSPQASATSDSSLRVYSAPKVDDIDVAASDIQRIQTAHEVAVPRADLVSAGAMGYAWKDVQSHEISELTSWDVREGLAAAKKMEEERAKLTAPPTFNEPSNYKPAGRTNGLAGKRHQLSALLQDAQSNRQALEDRISENKRTKREAGSKYGF